MNIFNYAVLFHILNECLLLNLLIAKTNRRSPRWLCNGSIFNFKATIIGIQHLNADKSAEFFLAQLSRSPTCTTGTILIYHALNKISGKLGLS